VVDKEKPGARRDLILRSQVAQAMTVLGDRVAFMIIRDVYLGIRHFEELRRRSRAARGTLTSRLKKLVEHGILYKHPYQSSPIRHEYRLTDKGLGLYPIVLTMWDWETKWGEGQYLPPQLTHKVCGMSMRPLFRCRACHRETMPQDFSFTAGANAALAKKVPARFQRRSKSSKPDAGGGESFSIFSIIGDRWTSLVIAAAFFGLQRYDDIVASIGIATNILADRLRLLVDVEVFVGNKYQKRPSRYEYHLSDKGRDLYAITLAMHEWADHWLIETGREPLQLHHNTCKKAFAGELVCSACECPIVPADVAYDMKLKQRRAG
jgi:DNA-binding HxlR family transcriptional regulator